MAQEYSSRAGLISCSTGQKNSKPDSESEGRCKDMYSDLLTQDSTSGGFLKRR